MIDLHELDRCSADLDKGNGHATAGTIRLDDDVMPFEGGRKVPFDDRTVAREELRKLGSPA